TSSEAFLTDNLRRRFERRDEPAEGRIREPAKVRVYRREAAPQRELVFSGVGSSKNTLVDERGRYFNLPASSLHALRSLARSRFRNSIEVRNGHLSTLRNPEARNPGGPESAGDALDGVGSPRLVLVCEPDQLGVERAHPQLALVCGSSSSPNQTATSPPMT